MNKKLLPFIGAVMVALFVIFLLFLSFSPVNTPTPTRIALNQKSPTPVNTTGTLTATVTPVVLIAVTPAPSATPTTPPPPSPTTALPRSPAPTLPPVNRTIVSRSFRGETFSGSGNSLSQPLQLEQGLARLRAKNTGDKDFSVRFYEANRSSNNEVAISASGNYNGNTFIEIKQTGRYIFEVRSSGVWELTIDDMFILNFEPAEKETLYRGNGDYAVKIAVAKAGFTNFSLRHTGQKTFTVSLISAKNPAKIISLVNATGGYLGEPKQQIEAGEYFLRVKADGGWVVEIKQ